jgi:hypothetical protein
MLNIINETNKERKLRPAEKNQLVDAIVEIGREERGRMEAESKAQMKSAQQQWEESIGANEIQQSIKTKCAEINELQVQLLENACEGVDAKERLNSYTGYYSDADKIKVKLKGEKLKRYKEHKKKMQSYESRGAATYERYIRVNAILGIETVAEAMKLIDEVTPELLDVKPVLAIECN